MAEVAEASEMEAVADSPPVKENGETGVEVLAEKVELETPVCESMTNVAMKEKAEELKQPVSDDKAALLKVLPSS